VFNQGPKKGTASLANGDSPAETASSSTPQVSIIILNWNSYDVTHACLLSLRSLDYPNFEVLLVDNGSADGSGVKLAADFPEVKLIRSEENRGFPGGNNLAIREALTGSADYLLLLNNDTEVAPDFLSQLVRMAETDPSIGIVNPKIFFYEPANRLWWAGGAYQPWHGLGKMRGVHQVDSGRYDKTEEISFATGCALLIKAEVVRRVGLLDEIYFLGFEDLDWTVRARAAGFKAYYNPAAVIWHKESYCTRRILGKPIKDFYSTRNRILFARRHMRGLYWPLFALSLTGYLLYRSAGYLLRREPQRVGGLLQGIWAGVSTKMQSIDARTEPLPSSAECPK
jgi:GT2 family glycosyltransferase